MGDRCLHQLRDPAERRLIDRIVEKSSLSRDETGREVALAAVDSGIGASTDRLDSQKHILIAIEAGPDPRSREAHATDRSRNAKLERHLSASSKPRASSTAIRRWERLTHDARGSADRTSLTHWSRRNPSAWIR